VLRVDGHPVRVGSHDRRPRVAEHRVVDLPAAIAAGVGRPKEARRGVRANRLVPITTIIRVDGAFENDGERVASRKHASRPRHEGAVWSLLRVLVPRTRNVPITR